MKRSVALETTWFVVLTIVLVVLVEVFSQHFLTNHNQELAEQQAQTDLNTYSLALQRQIGFYQRLLEGLARRTNVHDLLQIGNQEESFQWALNYRRLLPDTVGLSLIDHDGEIQGNPDSLLIGPKCRVDILSLSQGNIFDTPAVHRDTPGLEHFDLFAPVSSVDGEHLGYVFASIKLPVIQELLNAMTHNGHKLTVVAADQTPVASIDQFADTTEDTIELAQPVTGTAWLITLVSQPAGMEKAFVTLLIATSILALFVGISVVLLSRHLSRGLLREVLSIRTALEQIAEGGDTPVDIQPLFRETAPLMDAVQDVSNRIQTQKETLRQLSETDSLTGLLNRRRFAQELKKAWALANRKVSAYIMTLDVDGFKQINDHHGHAAGDQILRAIADCLNDCTRSSDVVARLGGDEFVTLLIHSDEVTSLELFKRLGSCFEQAQAKLSIDVDLYCTISAGLACIDPGIDANVEASLQRSDEALYRAKHNGKNQIQQ